MSARDAMAQMLDELMGTKRNLDLGTDLTVTYDDPNICKYFIVGFCPHEMFVNTKADLGPCTKVHDDKLRIDYPNSSAFEKMGFERDFLRFLIQLEDENQRRIKRNKDKLNATDAATQKREEERVAGLKVELAKLEEEQNRVMKLMEEAGERSDAIMSMQLMQQYEILDLAKKELIQKIETPDPSAVPLAIAPILVESENRQKDVCEVCGSMLIRNDAQVRVEEHLMGKMHMGFDKIQNTIKELKEKFKQEDLTRDKEREERRKKREEERGSQRDRRDHRDRRDRDRDYRRRSRSRDRRDHSRDRHRRRR